MNGQIMFIAISSALAITVYAYEIQTQLIDEQKHTMIAKGIAMIVSENFEYRYVTLTVYFDCFSQFGISDFIAAYRGTVIIASGPLLTTMYSPVSIRQFVIYVNRVEELEEFWKFLRMSGYDNTGRFMIACPTKCDPAPIIRMCSDNYVTNVVIVIAGDGERADLYTYFPYQPSSCRNISPTLLASWSPTNSYSGLIASDLYQNKLQRLYGCEITVSTFEQPPFMYIRKGANDTQEATGIDGIILSMLAQALDFTLKLKPPQDGAAWGSYNGFQWSGSLGDVVYGRANMSACGAIVNMERAAVLQASTWYRNIDIVWVTTQPTPKHAWRQLFYPFYPKMWWALIFTYTCVVAIAVMMRIRRLRSFWQDQWNLGKMSNEMCMMSWVIFMGQGLKISSTTRIVLYTVFLWIWFSFFVRSAYQSSLIGALKIEEFEGVWETRGQAADAEVLYGGVRSTRQFFIDEPDVWNSFVELDSEGWYAALGDVIMGRRSFLLAGEIDIVLGHVYRYNGTRRVYIVKQKILNAPAVYLLRRFSPLAVSMNRVLVRLVEGGFTQRLENMYNSNQKMVTMLKTQKSRGQNVLRMDNLWGCFSLVLLGIFLSLIVFVVEMLLYRLKTNLYLLRRRL